MTSAPVDDILEKIDCPETAAALLTELLRTYAFDIDVDGTITPTAELTQEHKEQTRAVLSEKLIHAALDTQRTMYLLTRRAEMADLIDELRIWLVDAVLKSPYAVRNGTNVISARHRTVVQAVHAVTDLLTLPGWTAAAKVAYEEPDVDDVEETVEPYRDDPFDNAGEAWDWVKSQHGFGKKVTGFTLAFDGTVIAPVRFVHPDDM